ncbi:MAG: hypothetical protein WAO28_00215 [Candidatus Microsaccharimonas sp.]
MKKILTSGLVLLTLTATSVLPLSSVYAQTAASESARCKIATTRLDLRISNVEKVKTTQSAIYTQTKTKVDTFVASATDAGYDVTALTAARDSVKTKIDTYIEKATAYSAALTTAKSLTCGESDGAFTTALASARTALLATRTAALDVRTTFKQQVVPALNDYSTWLKLQKTDASGESN